MKYNDTSLQNLEDEEDDSRLSSQLFILEFIDNVVFGLSGSSYVPC